MKEEKEPVLPMIVLLITIAMGVIVAEWFGNKSKEVSEKLLRNLLITRIFP